MMKKVLTLILISSMIASIFFIQSPQKLDKGDDATPIEHGQIQTIPVDISSDQQPELQLTSDVVVSSEHSVYLEWVWVYINGEPNFNPGVNDVINVKFKIMNVTDYFYFDMVYRFENTPSWRSEAIFNQTTQDIYESPDISSNGEDTTMYYYLQVKDMDGNNALIDNNEGAYYKVRFTENTNAQFQYTQQVVNERNRIDFVLLDEDRNIDIAAIDYFNITMTNDIEYHEINVVLEETGLSTGKFRGSIYTGLENSADTIYIENNHTINIWFWDPAIPDSSYGLMVEDWITWYTPSTSMIQFNAPSYEEGDIGEITLWDGDANTNPDEVETIIVEIWSSHDTEGFDLQLVESSNNSGIFVKEFYFNQWDSDPANSTIRVGHSSGIYFNYLDKESAKGVNQYHYAAVDYQSNSSEFSLFSSHLPNTPEVGDTVEIMVIIPDPSNIDKVVFLDLEMEQSVIMNITTISQYESIYVIYYQIPVNYDKSNFTYVISVIFVDKSDWQSPAYRIDLKVGKMNVEWIPLRSQIIGEVEIRSMNKRNEMLSGVHYSIIGYHESSNETYTFFNDTVNENSFVLTIDPDMDLSVGKWVVKILASKLSYSIGKNAFLLKIAYGLEVNQRSNFIDDPAFTFNISATENFWIILQPIAIPLSIDYYVGMNDTFFSMQFLSVDHGQLPFDLFTITFKLDEVPDNLVMLYSMDGVTFKELNTIITSHSLQFNVTDVGIFGLAMS